MRTINTSHWLADLGLFALWGLASTACTVTVLGALSIGIFVAPLAGLLVGAGMFLTFRRSHHEFVVVGALLGPAALSSYIGASWAARVDSADGTHSHLAPARFLPFAVVTIGCASAALALFAVLGVRSHRRHPTGPDVR